MRFERWATVQIIKQLLILDLRQSLAEVNKAAFKVIFLNDIDAYQNLPSIAFTKEVSLLRLNTLIDHSSFNNQHGSFFFMWNVISFSCNVDANFSVAVLVYHYFFSSMFLSFLLIYDGLKCRTLLFLGHGVTEISG